MPSSERKKISVITTTFNLIKGGRKDVFIEMFKSVHGQTYPNIEHLIIDGGSKDGTIEFINDVNRQYGKKQLVIFSEPDEGISDATKKGFDRSTGDYVILMCSDDYYMRKDALELLANAIEQENVDYACADGWWLFKHRWKADISSFVYRQPFLITTWLVKRSVFEKYGHFDNYFQCLGDYELFFRILSKADVHGTEVHKVLTCLRPGGVSTSPDLGKKYMADLIILYRCYLNGRLNISERDSIQIHSTHPVSELIDRMRRYETNPIILKSFEKGLSYKRPRLRPREFSLKAVLSYVFLKFFYSLRI